MTDPIGFFDIGQFCFVELFFQAPVYGFHQLEIAELIKAVVIISVNFSHVLNLLGTVLKFFDAFFVIEFNDLFPQFELRSTPTWLPHHIRRSWSSLKLPLLGSSQTGKNTRWPLQKLTILQEATIKYIVVWVYSISYVFVVDRPRLIVTPNYYMIEILSVIRHLLIEQFDCFLLLLKLLVVDVLLLHLQTHVGYVRGRTILFLQILRAIDLDIRLRLFGIRQWLQRFARAVSFDGIQ